MEKIREWFELAKRAPQIFERPKPEECQKELEQARVRALFPTSLGCHLLKTINQVQLDISHPYFRTLVAPVTTRLLRRRQTKGYFLCSHDR